MTRVFVRLYAELNDFLPAERRGRTFPFDVEGTPTVRAVLGSLGVPPEEVELLLVDGTSDTLHHLVRDGERLACYPLFERIDLAPLLRIRASPLRRPRFAAAPALRRLALRLRALGFDVALGGETPPAQPPPAVEPGGRIALVPEAAALAGATHALEIRTGSPRGQLRDLIRRLGLEGELGRPPRCLRCNLELRSPPSSPQREPSAGAGAPAEAEARCPRCDHRAPRVLARLLRRALEEQLGSPLGEHGESGTRPLPEGG